MTEEALGYLGCWVGFILLQSDGASALPGVESSPRQEDRGPIPGVSVQGPLPPPQTGRFNSRHPPSAPRAGSLGSRAGGQVPPEEGEASPGPSGSAMVACLRWGPWPAEALPTSVTQRSPLRACHRAPGRRGWALDALTSLMTSAQHTDTQTHAVGLWLGLRHEFQGDTAQPTCLAGRKPEERTGRPWASDSGVLLG